MSRETAARKATRRARPKKNESEVLYEIELVCFDSKWSPGDVIERLKPVLAKHGIVIWNHAEGDVHVCTLARQTTLQDWNEQT